jgi:hypothetical protein
LPRTAVSAFLGESAGVWYVTPLSKGRLKMSKHALDRQQHLSGSRLRRFLEIERAQMPKPGTRALQANHQGGRTRPVSVIARLARVERG